MKRRDFLKGTGAVVALTVAPSVALSTNQPPETLPIRPPLTAPGSGPIRAVTGYDVALDDMITRYEISNGKRSFHVETRQNGEWPALQILRDSMDQAGIKLADLKTLSPPPYQSGVTVKYINFPPSPWRNDP